MSSNNESHTIKLDIDNKVLKSLKDVLATSMLCDNGAGLQYEFIEKIVRAIEDNKDEYTFRMKPKNRG